MSLLRKENQRSWYDSVLIITISLHSINTENWFDEIERKKKANTKQVKMLKQMACSELLKGEHFESIK